MQEPKARKDMDPRYLWDLSSIIESAAEFERQFKEAQAQVSAFSTWQGHVGENPRKAIREAMEMNRLLERLLHDRRGHPDPVLHRRSQQPRGCRGRHRHR